jgi:hypothetical protein
MKQLSNNTKINKEINYSIIKTMNIETLNGLVTINYSTNIIDFYIDTLKNYLPLNGINIGIDKISETIQQELYNLLYYPIKNELFNYQYLQDKHLNDFNDIFTFMLDGSYFDYNFDVDSLIGLINNQLNKLFIRIKKNRITKTILKEIEKNDTFILDNLKEYKNLSDVEIAKLIIDMPFTQLLSYFYYYENKTIQDYNSDNLNTIVLDIHNLITSKPFYNRLLKVINFELDNCK